MNVAIVGCGFIANTHANALKDQNQNIVLSIGSSEEKAKEFSKKWKIEHYSSRFEEALRDEIDCVHICTPPHLHYEMAKAALFANKHVVCEKPLCLDSLQAKELWKISQNMNKFAAVNYNIRYNDACQKARNIVADDKFGAPLLVQGSYKQAFSLLPCRYMWRYIPEIGGKMRVVTEIGSHLFDLIRFVTGQEIVEVCADFGYFWKNRIIKDGMMYAAEEEGIPLQVDTEDAANILIRFENGAKGSLILSQISHGRSNYVSFEISSANRSVWWESEDPLKLHTAKHTEGINTKVNAYAGGFSDSYKSFFMNVYKRIEKWDKDTSYKNIPSFFDGYKNAAICEAVFESANNNSRWMEVK